jgi:hypothetical protein
MLALALDRRVDVWFSSGTYRLPKILEDVNVHMVECGERKVAATHQRLFQEFKRFDPTVDKWILKCRDELTNETEKLLDKEIEKEKAALTKRAKAWQHGGIIINVGDEHPTLTTSSWNMKRRTRLRGQSRCTGCTTWSVDRPPPSALGSTVDACHR